MEQSMRPVFLTFLCILTFIGSASSIFSSISNYKNPEITVGTGIEFIETMMDNLEEEFNTEEEAVIFESLVDSVIKELTVENVRNIALASGISSLLTLIGAILMWGLDKKGYWLYLIGTLVAIFTPIMIYEGVVGIITGVAAAFIGILFCILYGVNTKHLK